MDVNGISVHENPVAGHGGAPVEEAAAARPAAETEAVKSASPPAPAPEERPPDKQPDTVSLKKAVEQINRALQSFNREMHISVHPKLNRIMVKVVDTEQHKVIREIPPEKALDAFARALELAGILIDKKS